MLIEVELRAWDGHPEAEKRNLGYNNSGLRYVDVPDIDVPGKHMFHNNKSAEMSLLERVWYFGQNDFQPKQQRSLMVDDVIRIYERRFVIDNFGFTEVEGTNNE